MLHLGHFYPPIFGFTVFPWLLALGLGQAKGLSASHAMFAISVVSTPAFLVASIAVRIPYLFIHAVHLSHWPLSRLLVVT